MLARMNNSISIVECGTSFGISTVYLALAVAQNAAITSKTAHGILTVEKNSEKLAKAREMWAQAGEAVNKWIHSEEGDLLDILADAANIPDTIDFLFLDGK
jgi:predicted O-methyltransferase YrrM